MTGGEDGLLRGVGVFPNQIVGVLGQHEENQQFPISKIAMDHTKRIVASISHDNSIKFHDVIEFMGKRAGVHDVP
jgi:ATP-dependent RNA helicase DOB1